MPTSAICNASPLIALHQLDQLELLPQLFTDILIPTAVAQEISTVQPHPNWLQETPLTQKVGPQILRASLGPGESETISLALETGNPLVILDDRPARRLASTLGLSVIGTLGILLAAKRRDLIPALRPLLDTLRQNNFHIADNLYKLVLHDANE